MSTTAKAVPRISTKGNVSGPAGFLREVTVNNCFIACPQLGLMLCWEGCVEKTLALLLPATTRVTHRRAFSLCSTSNTRTVLYLINFTLQCFRALVALVTFFCNLRQNAKNAKNKNIFTQQLCTVIQSSLPLVCCANQNPCYYQQRIF